MIQGSVGQFDESEPKRKEKKQKKGGSRLQNHTPLDRLHHEITTPHFRRMSLNSAKRKRSSSLSPNKSRSAATPAETAMSIGAKRRARGGEQIDCSQSREDR
ncbi:hypothetical protein MCOR11_006526 [Pyricularia oryzae]|nr:hypothetical protein MCOR24_003092 [Pyricularia oryzae]KAI6492703.1 hypothetical protein MCOR11_006526 [Pyricularia oryzae]